MTKAFDLATCTELGLWHHVAAHLEARGVGVVLVGGAVVASYSQGAYRSGDLEFVTERYFEESVDACMRELGFRRKGKHYEHPRCRHVFVEFVAGPLGIGDDTSIVPSTESVGGQKLKILSPTDCVRDRLASYIHYDARECLDWAALVADARSADWRKLAAWCRAEGPKGATAFEDLRRRSKRR
jgi:hypothetical protein